MLDRTDTRHKNSNWILRTDQHGRLQWEAITVSVLMDIRDELQAINRKLDCWRVGAALDALGELGIKLRREKRIKRKKKR